MMNGITYNAHRFWDAADSAEAAQNLKELMKFPGPHVVVVDHRLDKGFKYCLFGRRRATEIPKLW